MGDRVEENMSASAQTPIKVVNAKKRKTVLWSEAPHSSHVYSHYSDLVVSSIGSIGDFYEICFVTRPAGHVSNLLTGIPA